MKGPDNVFCHMRKVPPNKFQSRPFGREFLTPEHDKIIQKIFDRQNCFRKDLKNDDRNWTKA